MKTYAVRQVAEMSGVTVRTLHHYDRIGLLVPASRSDAGYREYGEGDLLRLQQILFHRELGFSLAEIRDILDDPDFDRIDALRNHGRALEENIGRLRRLQGTLDRTIHRLEAERMGRKQNDLVTDEELYEGFASREEGKALEREAKERWGTDAVEESNRRVRKMTKGEWKTVRAEGESIYADFAALAGRGGPEGAEVRAVVARHRSHIGHFYEVTPEVYSGLAKLYVEDDRFRDFFERLRPGLADFVAEAMNLHAEEV